MLKKFGAVTIGVAASLAAAAPLASAHEGQHHGDAESSSCNVTGGSAEANGGIGGDALAGNLLSQAPVGGANVGNIVCNDILNGNLSGNTADVSVGGSDDAEATPTEDDETADDETEGASSETEGTDSASEADDPTMESLPL